MTEPATPKRPAGSSRYGTEEYREWNRERMRRLRADPEYLAQEAERSRERYQNLSGVAYNRALLRGRRNKALARMAERNQRKEASG
jgi:hypothetical protein